MPLGRKKKSARSRARHGKAAVIVEDNATLTKEMKTVKKKLRQLKPEQKYVDFRVDNFVFAESNSAASITRAQPVEVLYPKQGDEVNMRNGDRILVKKIELNCNLEIPKLTMDLDYQIHVLKYMEKVPSTGIDTTLMNTYLGPDLNPGDPTVIDGISTRSFRNWEHMRDWKVLKVYKGKAKLPGATNNGTGYSAYFNKTIRMVIPREDFLQFEKQGGSTSQSLINGAYVFLFVAGNRSDTQAVGQFFGVTGVQGRLHYTDV